LFLAPRWRRQNYQYGRHGQVKSDEHDNWGYRTLQQ